MKYQSGIEVILGDNVTVNIPTGAEPARVVMLGETYEHLDLDKNFLDWVKKDRVLEDTSVVIEWINKNPFEHNDPKYAPVGNYMFTGLDSGVSFQKRGT
jgi:hypothetical protein